MIRFRYNVAVGNVVFKSGNFYEFEYNRFENDPKPMIVFMYLVQGIHPTSGHYHNYIQAVNLSYIPKKLRATWVKRWIDTHWNPRTQTAREGIRLDYYRDIDSYLHVAVRRYFIKGGNIIKPKDIPFDVIDAKLAGISGKDYYSRAVLKRAQRLLQRGKYSISKKKRKRPAPTPPGKAKARKPAKSRPRKVRPRR